MELDLDLARRVARQGVLDAGALLMQHWKQKKTFAFKGRQDIVSTVDLEAEKRIIAAIRAHFPGHRILSEEAGWTGAAEAAFCWIIDPLDGTINYVHDAAPLRVGVCLLYRGEPLLSVILNPIKQEIYEAGRDGGGHCNGVPLQVSSNTELGRAVVMTHLSSQKEARIRTLQALDSIFQHTLHLRMFGSGLSALTYVASGKFDVFFNVYTKPWDILPGVPLLEAAGGRISDLEGRPLQPGSNSVLATNGLLHEPMLELLRKSWQQPLPFPAQQENE